MRITFEPSRGTNDLIELCDYIADDIATRADPFIDEVDAKFDLLAEQPMLGCSRKGLALQPVDVS
jgi:plasmid stabilization system protein ParE